MSKHILLVHDLAGYGKVSLSAMMPVLSHMGHHLYTLPTALEQHAGLREILHSGNNGIHAPVAESLGGTGILV